MLITYIHLPRKLPL